MLMKLVKGLSYRQWQQRNTSYFKALAKDAQKEIRAKGYYNVGWEKVQKSWKIISESKVINLIDYKLKSDNLDGAINIVSMESENANKLANKAINDIQLARLQLNELVVNTIDKYSKF